MNPEQQIIKQTREHGEIMLRRDPLLDRMKDTYVPQSLFEEEFPLERLRNVMEREGIDMFEYDSRLVFTTKT